MALSLANDFKDFLRLLNSKRVKYLLIGGYAVSHDGSPRATGDLDVWVARTNVNAAKLVNVLQEFGFDVPGLREELFLEKSRIVRMGIPPLLTTITGVEFADCCKSRVAAVIDGVSVPIISLKHLRRNKLASGRHKDLDDLENLPTSS
ncbi:MAG: hypothetical protein KF861_15540 [Planctomycetaceae bacterium]|nr:hypothetical protein [Planctomycetaceae bacterium]